MADRPIDRRAWAALVSELIETEARGKKAAFARLVGVDPKTIAHWLAGTVDVSEASVRRVATALGRPTLDLLVEVGYYSREEVGGEPASAREPMDPDLLILARRLADPNVPAAEKATIRATLQYLANLAERTPPKRQWHREAS